MTLLKLFDNAHPAGSLSWWVWMKNQRPRLIKTIAQPTELQTLIRLFVTHEQPMWRQVTQDEISRKEVIQPQVPLRLPCYDFTPVANPTVAAPPLRLGYPLLAGTQLPWCDGRCVQGPGTYSPRHADPRLLAIPTSCSRVADCDPDYDRLFGIGSTSRLGNPLYRPLYDV